MKTRLRISLSVLVGVCLIMLMLLFAKPVPSNAQLFATNTPRPPDPLNVVPELPDNRYALRLWSPSQLIDVLISLLGRGTSADPDFFAAVRLMQYEIAQRYPNIPQDDFTRRRLLDAMLSAPRGSADMRGVARSLALAQLNGGQGELFKIEQVAIINIDGDDYPDGVYRLRIPADIATPALYEDYIIVRGTADGSRQLSVMPADIVAAPYRDVLAIDLLAVGDYTGNGLDEVLIRLDRASGNDRLAVYGWRNGAIVDLALPNAPIYFGEVVNLATGTLQVVRYDVNSARWGCYSSKGVQWVWSNNFFRPVEDTLPAYLQLNTIGCQIVAEEPLYEKSPQLALSTLQTILINRAPDETGYAHASLAIAMLQWLNDQKADASLRLISLSNLSNLSPHMRAQIATLQQALARNISPIEGCALLSGENGVCDIDQLMTRIFTENTISRVGDIRTQLTTLGLPVQSLTTVTQVGRADRLVVTFALPNASQWAFAPLNEQVYVAEKLGGRITHDNVMAEIHVPQTAYDALLIDGDGVAALNILENLHRQNSGVPLSLEAQYFRALCLDLIGDRPNAVSAYLQLWRAVPDDLWGRLAGAHLEPR